MTTEMNRAIGFQQFLNETDESSMEIELSVNRLKRHCAMFYSTEDTVIQSQKGKVICYNLI